MRDLFPAIAVGLLGTIALFGTILAPKPGGTVIVVFPAGTTAEDAMLRVIDAGLRPIATPIPSMVLAGPDGWPVRRPAGAWTVLDAMGLRGCT